MNENKTATMNLAAALVDFERTCLLFMRNITTDEAERHDYDVKAEECKNIMKMLGVER